MAVSTYMTYLLKGTESSGSVTYEKLVDIKDYSDLGSMPDKLDTTTLSDAAETGILGIVKRDNFEFTANYDATDYQTLTALAHTDTHYAIAFGSTTTGSGGSATTTYGTQGMWKFKGDLACWPVGGGVDEVRDMKIAIAPSTDLAFSVSNG